MTNITQTVWGILSQDPSIQKNMQRKLINKRALAKYIIKQYGLDGSIDSAISAIRRYPSSKAFKESKGMIKAVFSGANLTTKTNLGCLMLKNYSDIRTYLSGITRIIDLDKKGTLRIIKAKSGLKIITDMLFLPSLKSFFPRGKDFEIKENLCELTINLKPEADQTKGVIARVTNELLANDINLSEIIFCNPELIIYVEQKDLLKAHESLLSLCR